MRLEVWQGAGITWNYPVISRIDGVLVGNPAKNLHLWQLLAGGYPPKPLLFVSNPLIRPLMQNLRNNNLIWDMFHPNPFIEGDWVGGNHRMLAYISYNCISKDISCINFSLQFSLLRIKPPFRWSTCGGCVQGPTSKFSSIKRASCDRSKSKTVVVIEYGLTIRDITVTPHMKQRFIDVSGQVCVLHFSSCEKYTFSPSLPSLDLSRCFMRHTYPHLSHS